MFNRFRQLQFQRYKEASELFATHPERLIAVEEFVAKHMSDLIRQGSQEIWEDYNEASFLFPFWQNYPPSNRGRKPKGDQIPWIEVGEHVIGRKLTRWLAKDFGVRDCGIPTGADERFVLSSKSLRERLIVTDSCWVFVDIKSVGPRDDSDHAVMSHNQITGDGTWSEVDGGTRNQPIIALGKRRQHEFHCAIPPIYILSDGTVVPVVTVIIKPVYGMKTVEGDNGQPLERITIATVPNGILLARNPGYLSVYPGLFFPGKDKQSTKPDKVRARVSFKHLREIAAWRVTSISQDPAIVAALSPL